MAPPFAARTSLLLGLFSTVAAAPQNEGCDCRACTEVVARQEKEIARLQDQLRSLRGQVDLAGRRLDGCYRDWTVHSNTDVDAFRLEGCHAVRTLFIGAEIDSVRNCLSASSITSLAGLSSLKTADSLTVSCTAVLQSLEGLQGLTHVDRLIIRKNGQLSSISALQGLEAVKEEIQIESNDQLQSLDGLQGLETARDVTINTNGQLQSLDGLQGLRHVEGMMTIFANLRLESLNGLQGLETAKDLIIQQSPQLRSLDGLQGLETARDIRIYENIPLQSLDGLQGLRHVERELHVQNSEVRSLDGLQGLKTAGSIIMSYSFQLQSLDGLRGLVEVGQLILNTLPELRSIAALSGLTSAWRGGIIIDRCGLHSLEGLGVSTVHVSLLHVGNTPLDVLGGPFAGGSTVHNAHFDEVSWPRCFTLHERTSLLSVVEDVYASSIPNATWHPECGPDFGTFSCTKGHPCSFSLAGEENSTSVFVSARLVGCGACSANYAQGKIAEGGVVDLGYALRDEEAGLRSVCRCDGGIGPVAQLLLRGARKGPVQACSRGRNCTLRLEGEALEGTDRVVLLASCMHSDPSSGFVPSLTADSSYLFQNNSAWYAAPAGQYQVCWRAPCTSVVDGPTCPAPEDSYFHVGDVELRGAFARNYTPVLGEGTFSVPNIGFEVGDGDQMRLRRACSEADEEESHVLAANSSGMVFDFGRLLENRVEAGKYHLCWCHGSKGAQCNAARHFMASAGVVHIRCPAGKELVDSRRCESCPPGKQQPLPGLDPCLECPIGQFARGGNELCDVCLIGEVARVGGRSACIACRPWQSPDAEAAGCIANPMDLVLIALLSLVLSAISSVLVGSIRRQLLVVDVSLSEHQTTVTTSTPHGLSNFGHASFPVQFHGTRNRGLDSPSEPFRARVKGAVYLELLTSDNESIDKRLDTSMGTLTVDFPHDLRHQRTVAVGLPLLFTAAGALGVLALSAGLMADPLLWATTAAALACTLTGAALRRRQLQATPTPLDVRLQEFRVAKLGQRVHGVERTAKGPNRAITLGKMHELLGFFYDFIRDRTAYYLESNVLRPLTEPLKVSYAELVGAETVEWFVSHYWGTAFTHFCASLQKHAETACGSSDWRSLKYWICFCSNNQHEIEDELGGEAGWVESSFYLALHSGRCRGTCMVLDDKALPLTRVWCIFELLQTVKLERNEATFQGLLLCTSSGVLNSGGGSAEVAMALGDRVAGMNLETAESSSTSDAQMIRAQVTEEMGSFDELNHFICGEMRTMLIGAQQNANQHFAGVLANLDAAMAANRRASL